MASIRTGLIGVTVLAFVALQSCSSSTNDDDQGTPRTGGSAGIGVATSGGTSTTPQGGAVATGGAIPGGDLSCSYRGTCAHPYCTDGAALNPSCSKCAYEVCALFPLCCIAMWDANCMLTAQDKCDCACGVNTGGSPGSTGGRPPTGGSAGKAGTAGTAGVKTGGAGGAGGAKTGGAGGGGGVSSAGQDGTAGVAEAGAGGVSADGGASPGGAGDTGGVPPATGGSGGAGGSAPTFAENCATVCNMLDAASGFSACTTGASCVDSCTGYTDPDLYGGTAEFPPMVECLAGTTASDWTCSTGIGDLTFGAIPLATTSCEDLVCAWVCADFNGIVLARDDTVVARCGGCL
jgi:hypothetical protein